MLSVSLSGGLESTPLVRGVRGRSISMKAPIPSRAKQGAFKTMPLRWSFGHREKPLVASVELVEYLESRRRPRSTSQSIVPLLTGTAGGDEKSVVLRSNATLSAQSEDSGRTNEKVLAGVPCPADHPSQCAVPGISDGLNSARKLKENARQDIRLPKQFDLPLTVMPSMESEKRAWPEGLRTANWKGSGQAGSSSKASSPKEPSRAAALSRNSADTRRNPLAKVRANTEGRDSETDRFSQGTLTLLRSVFWKKENKKNDRAAVAPQVSPVSLESGRLSLVVDEQARGSSPSLRIPENLARGPASRLEGAVRSAPSSLHLPRKASRPTRSSALNTLQGRVLGEQPSFGTLQKVKYHTLSLGRKKTLPESSF